MHRWNGSFGGIRARGLVARAAIAVAAAFAFCSGAQAGLVGLSSGSPGALFNINSATGAASHIVNVSPGITSFVGLEYLGGKYYGTDILPPGSGFSFGTIDPTTGAFTVLNTQGGSANWHGLAGNEAAGLLYTIDIDAGNVLKSIDTAGVITTIGPTGGAVDGRGMAYDDANGILYATGGGSLWTVSTATGVATLVGAIGVSDGVMGLAYDELTDTLYANEGGIGGAGTSALYTLNVATGAATLVGANGALPAGTSFLDGLTWLPDAVPEPSAFGLVALGLLALRRRRAA